MEANWKYTANSMLLLVFMLVLAGCATSNIQKDFTFNSSKATGLIFGSFTQDKGARGGIFGIFYIRKANGEQFAHVESREKGPFGPKKSEFAEVSMAGCLY